MPHSFTHSFIGASILLLFSVASAQAQNSDPALTDADRPALALLTGGQHALLIRHALAPGTGDPTSFRLDDCSTQRNLDATGRAQARAIGDWFRARGIASARVYSSQWCRCLETARLLDLGAVNELPALNSFFQRPGDREPNLSELREFLNSQSPTTTGPLILVTHQVTISAITGSWTASGEGVLIELDEQSGYPVRARLTFGN